MPPALPPGAPPTACRALAWSTLASALLHAGLAGALLWAVQPSAAPPPRNDRLAVELYGMIAERQTAQRSAAEAPPEAKTEPTPEPPQPQPQPPPPPRPRPEPKPKPKTPPPPQPQRPATQSTAPSPVQIPVQEQAEEEPAPAPPPSPPQTAAPPADAPQPQQRLSELPDAQTLLKQYLGRLTKQIQAHLTYPESVKRSGYEGSATVRFVLTPSGHLQPDSLQITASTGHPLLDASALQAVQDGAPFEPPPRQLPISMSIAFSQKR